MRSGFSPSRVALAAAVGAAVAVFASAASADDLGSASEVEVPAAPEVQDPEKIQQASSPQAFTGKLARDDWRARRRWGYGTQQLYPLTLGMDDAGIPPLARWPLYPFTALFDTGNLVFSAIGGLYGD